MEHVWFRCSLNIRINQQAVTSFGQWLRNVIEEGKTLQERSQCLIVIAYFCWQIWKDRCKAVLEYISLSPTRTIHAASTAINEFLGTLDHGRHQTEPPTLSNATSLEPPASPFVKINVDVSWNPNSRRVGIGILIRDTHGDFLNGTSIPSVAEVLACLEGCKLATEMGCHHVTFEYDCKEIISSLKGSISKGS
ncbi:unnamed protein product [Prunus armeniaca]